MSVVDRLRGGATKCDVILVGCGVPKRGMGWYHAKQMLDGDCPSAELTAVVEPWFLGAGADSDAGKTFKEWADEMEAEHGTKFVKDISELEIKACTDSQPLGKGGWVLRGGVRRAVCVQELLEERGAMQVLTGEAGL